MKKILLEFYYPIIRDDGFQAKAEQWKTNIKTFAWDTSVLKIVDNLVIGAVREKKDVS